MQRKLTCFLLLGIVAVAGGFHATSALATPAVGFTGTTVGLARFEEIDIFRFVLPGQLAPSDNTTWVSLQKTQGSSDVYVQNNVWQPGGNTGWHTHPGHSLIIVTAGSITAYEGDDPTCTPTVYTQGMGFVDPGGDHVHLIRNEGTVPAMGLAVQVIPAGAPRRIDAPSPGNCSF